VGSSDVNVMILGENGIGKGVVVCALHAVLSWVSWLMVIVNSGGVSEGVFESEFFGYVRGAFMDVKVDRVGCFEFADQGMLFFDEIVNVLMSQQVKLLCVIEIGEFECFGSLWMWWVDMRILLVINVNFGEEVVGGCFW